MTSPLRHLVWGLRANKKGRRCCHWQSKTGSCQQGRRPDPTGGDDLIGVKAAGICLDTSDMTSRQIQRAQRIVRRDVLPIGSRRRAWKARVFEEVVARCIRAGLVGGEGFAIDASVIEAAASRRRKKSMAS